jgi:hypothetical protein
MRFDLDHLLSETLPKFSLQDPLTKMAFNHGGRHNSRITPLALEKKLSPCAVKQFKAFA